MKRWKWTRKRYEHARRLSRLLLCLATVRRITPTEVVENYWMLMRPVEQQVDPMDSTNFLYKPIIDRLRNHKDGMPF